MAHAWFIALAEACKYDKFEVLCHEALKRQSSRAAMGPSAEMQHMYGRGDGRGHSRFQRDTGPKKNCPRCNRQHPARFQMCKACAVAERQAHTAGGAGRHAGRRAGGPETSRGTGAGRGNGGPFNQNIQHIELQGCTADVELSLCVDSGTTHVVTPSASELSNYRTLAPGQGAVKLATDGSQECAVGVGTLQLRSRATGSLLTFHNALHVPKARRTLLCLGRSMRCGVYWHFSSPTGGYIETAENGYWGHIILDDSNLLFLDADVVRPEPSATNVVIGPVELPPTTIELSNVELTHRRLGHPGHRAIKQLAAWGKIPTSDAKRLPTACVTCVASKGSDVRRLPKRNPAQRVHVDLIGPI